MTETATRPDLVHRFRAMATTVTVRVVDPTAAAPDAVRRVEDLFARVQSSCTRFDPTSPLMQANAAGRRRSQVDRTCFDALREAHQAYLATDGAFDPRTLESLTALGYDRTLHFDAGEVRTQQPVPLATAAPRRWRPSFDQARCEVRVGPRPVDLGGIGKGLAVRAAIELLRGDDGTGAVGSAALVEAGGDLATTGPGPEGAGWRASVEDPTGGPDPVAVVDVTDAAAATSSVRVRSWTAGDRRVHHLIDPRTGRPAESGLLAVTVIGSDPATAEVWSKALFVAGSAGIRSTADTHGLAALWVHESGRLGVSAAARPRLIWRTSRVD